MRPTWESGGIQLYLADCLEVLPTLEAGSVDAVVTDPPYGIGFKYNSHEDDAGTYPQFMRDVIASINVAIGDGPVFLWQAMPNCARWHEWLPEQYRIFAACKGFVQYRPTPVQFSWDPVIFWGAVRCDKPSVYRKDYHEQRKAPFGKNRPKVPHPCPRPLEQVEYIINLASISSDTILDPFMGSGTTGVACVQTGRKFIGIEIDPGYFEIARQRIEAAQNEMIQETFI